MNGLASVFRNPDLRRLQLSWAGHFFVEWGQLVALSIYAYDVAGAAGVGLIGFVRALPAAAVLPFGALLADRFPRQLVLAWVHLLRAALLTAMALGVLVEVPVWLVFALAAGQMMVAAPLRPAQWAMAPVLARSPDELVGANASASTLEGLATVAGPVVVTGLVLQWGEAAGLAMCAAVSLWCVVLVVRISAQADPTRAARATEDGGVVLAGFRVLRDQPRPRLVIGLFVAQTLVRGLLNVLTVALAVDVLGLGEAGVGLLTAAFGVGILVGGVGATVLTGRRRLAAPFQLGLVLWGLPIFVVGLWPNTATALVAMAAVGVGNAVLDVSGYTLVQRAVDDRMLGRVFGAFEVSVLVTVALGSLVAAPLVETLGVADALIATGLLLPTLAVLATPGLRRIDDDSAVPVQTLALLADVPLFAPLSATSLEKLALSAVPEERPAGAVISRQGEHGETFWVIQEGRVAVVRDGVEREEIGPGRFLGEIATIYQVPRTATAVARTDVVLLALTRDAFVAAVLGHRGSSAAVDATLATYAGLRPPGAAIGDAADL